MKQNIWPTCFLLNQKLLNCIPVMLGHVHWVQRFLFSFLNPAHSGSFCNQNCDLNTLLYQTHFAFQQSALKTIHRLLLFRFCLPVYFFISVYFISVIWYVVYSMAMSKAGETEKGIGGHRGRCNKRIQYLHNISLTVTPARKVNIHHLDHKKSAMHLLVLCFCVW